MRRWNGWGDDSVQPSTSPAIGGVLASVLGPGLPPRDLTLDEAVEMVPPSRLGSHALLSSDPAERLRHARGESLPDLMAVRSGLDLTFPDAVACPTSSEEVRALLDHARRTGVRLIPYGGGTSVTGHVNVLPSEHPVVTVDMSRLEELHDLDTTSGLATFGAGISGKSLETRLRQHGLTLGHFPQSFEYSTLGGWIATRSKGQQSIYYGGIERLLAGARLETPVGTFDLPPQVASSTGPDLRELVVGSEGRPGPTR